MNELARRRANKVDDARQWSPLDALEWLAEEIRAGRANPKELIIHYLSDAGGDEMIHSEVAAGITLDRHICLLNVALRSTLNGYVR